MAGDRRGAGPGQGRIDVENETFTVHNPFDVGPVAPLPVLIAALGPVMLKIAGERADGTVLWMADERAIGDHVVPKITKAAEAAGRPAPRVVAGHPGLPVLPVAGGRGAGARQPDPRRGGDLPELPAPAGARRRRATSATCARPATRPRSPPGSGGSPTPGSPTCRSGLLPIGNGRDELIASKHRTRDVLAGIAADLRSDQPGPLAGIRILEVGHMLAGPYATMMLADLGADVTKIEPPGGDISRQVGDTYFASLNRGKRSVCLDLGSADGQRRLAELVAGAHALLVNLKPSRSAGSASPTTPCKSRNERIVCVALTGYGLDGGDDPAFDYLIQAATGVASLTGDPDGTADPARLLLG